LLERIEGNILDGSGSGLQSTMSGVELMDLRPSRASAKSSGNEASLEGDIMSRIAEMDRCEQHGL
jgi:hypothetical protein